MAHHPRRSPYHAGSGAAEAFADGRRLRQAAAQRRRERARRSVPHRRHVGHRIGVTLVLLPFAVMGLTGMLMIMFFAGLAAVGAVASLMPMILIGGMVFAAVRQRRREIRTAGTAPLPARPAFRPALPTPEQQWRHAHHRFRVLQSAYAAHECDPMAVLRLPALSDVSVPSTGRFVDAFAEASALDTDAFPGEHHAWQFVRAVDLAERSWRAARDAAERIRLSGLSPAERATVERVVKLLTTARDSDSEPERLAAYTRARAELAKLDAAGIVHMPRLARDRLDAAARGALPA